MGIKVAMRYGGSGKGNGNGNGNGGGGGSSPISSVSASANTLAPGSSATASATLSDDSLSFVFGIPAGATGSQGEQGPKGDTGEQGIQGPQGETGPAGGTGPQGETGPQGSTGDPGPRGTGTLHVTTAPSAYSAWIGTFEAAYRMGLSTIKTQSGVDEVYVGDIVEHSYYHYPIGYIDGSYAYMGQRTSIRGEVGATGATGATGASGSAGSAATISVGTVSTGAAGSSASVTNSGTSSAAVFDFVIPRGDTGEQGIQGIQGPAGATGEQGIQGPQGDTGSQGPQGDTGPAGATGNGIASIVKTGTSGLVDTYTITFTDGSTTTFTVTNGQDGSGSGDMMKSVYDTDDDGVVDEAETVTNTSGSGSIEFGLDANGKGQYRASGASTWIPFLSGPTKTELWRNDSPSSTFAEQSVVAFNPSDYDALEIVWKGVNTQSATPSNWETDATAQAITYDLRHYASRTSAVNQIFLPATSYTGSTYTYIRRVWFVASQWTPGEYNIHIGPTQRTNNANNNAAYNIPLLIYGVKY